MTTEQKNKVIALFMGATEYKATLFQKVLFPFEYKKFLSFPTGILLTPLQCGYHKSLDSIYPVVMKINNLYEQLLFSVPKEEWMSETQGLLASYACDVDEACYSFEINKIYQSVFQFCNWYLNQKP